MAYGNTALTFSDLRKRMDPDGKIAWIMEIMAQSNPIMQHIPWMEGNLPTGNQTTLRTSYPHPQLRRINRGITPGKSTTRHCRYLLPHGRYEPGRRSYRQLGTG